MTDNEITKSLECCSKEDCDNCPSSKFGSCIDIAMEEAIALIDRQKAEVERLKEDNEALNSAVSSALDIVNGNYQIGRAVAIKEFAERLKENEREHCQWCNHSNKGSRSEWCDEIINGHCRCLGFSKFESKLDNLVKEMVGADNGERT